MVLCDKWLLNSEHWPKAAGQEGCPAAQKALTMETPTLASFEQELTSLFRVEIGMDLSREDEG